jgi:GPI ethanolamine phosphate transferase 1
VGSRYKGNIAYVDQAVQQLVEALDAFYDHDRQTAYVFTADHGMNDRGTPSPFGEGGVAPCC